MKRLFLHAGHFKTGTTSAQFALAAHREQLRASGILYPLYDGLLDYQHGAALMFWHEPWRARLKEFWLKEAARLRACPEQQIILSGEAATHLSRADFQLFRELFPDFHLTLVFSLRHWFGFAHSRWSEHVECDDSLTFPRMLKLLDSDFASSVSGDQSLTLRRAQGSFDAIMPVPYTSANALLDLFDALGLPPELARTIIANTKRANQSPSFVDLEAMRLCNLIWNSRRGRPAAAAYLSSITPAPLVDRGARRVRRAFLSSDEPAAQSLRALALAEKKEASKERWAPLFADWTARLNASLTGAGLPAMPQIWGEDERAGSISFTRTSMPDVPPELARSYMQYAKTMLRAPR